MDKLKLVVSRLIEDKVKKLYAFDLNYLDIKVTAKQTVFHNATHDVTVVMSIKPRGYVLHFMDGTQEKHQNYFSITTDLENVDKTSLIIATHLSCEVSKQQILETRKS